MKTSLLLGACSAALVGCMAPAELENSYQQLCESGFAGRTDPFACLMGADARSPRDVEDLLETLKAGCSGESEVNTRMIAEEEQLNGKAQNSYRSVISFECEGSRKEDLMIATPMSGRAVLDDDGKTAVDDSGEPVGAPFQSGGLIEVIAFEDRSPELDGTQGVFNYYTVKPSLQFEGDSIQAVDPSQGRNACGACHTGGGLVMKELDSPWLNWEHTQKFDGVQAALDQTPYLGEGRAARIDGNEMEDLVKDSTPRWNRARIEHWIAQDRADKLLEPLFCHTELNLDNGGSKTLSSFPGDFFADLHLSDLLSFSDRRVNVKDELYSQAIEELGQVIPSQPDLRESPFRFAFIERSFADHNYVELLEEMGIVDEELILDVLLVDFTRPFDSNERCGIKDKLAGLSTGGIDAQAIVEHLAGTGDRDGTLSTSLPAEAMLLENLDVQGGHIAVVEGFLDACRARANPPLDEGIEDEGEREAARQEQALAFLKDVIRVAERGRNLARVERVFEHPDWLPKLSGSAPNPDLRLDPLTCEATTDFVAVPVAPERQQSGE